MRFHSPGLRLLRQQSALPTAQRCHEARAASLALERDVERPSDQLDAAKTEKVQARHLRSAFAIKPIRAAEILGQRGHQSPVVAFRHRTDELLDLTLQRGPRVISGAPAEQRQQQPRNDHAIRLAGLRCV